MTINVPEIKRKVYASVKDNHLFDAILEVKKLVEYTKDYALNAEFDRIYSSYKYMIEYMTKGGFDPNRNAVVTDVIMSILTLTDKAIIAIKNDTSTELYYVRRKLALSQNFEELISKYHKENDKIFMFKENIQEGIINDTELLSLYQKLEDSEKELFNYIWTDFPSSETNFSLLEKLVLNDDSVSLHFKQMLIGAILLGLLQFYDERKVTLLLNLYINHSSSTNPEEIDLSIRALTCAVIAFYRHNRRVSSSKQVSECFTIVSEMTHLKDDLECIYLNLLKAKNTDKVSRSLEQSILPDILKMAPGIIDKAKSNNGVIDINALEGNPEWEKIFDESGIFKKIEKFSKMQSAGGDVFMATFEHLKHFQFFRDLCNWFRPFYEENSTVKKAIDSTSGSIKNIISNTPLCDSDKYSFVLSMKDIDEQQRDMMLQQFDAKNSNLDNLQENVDVNASRADLINKYIKDLYRFFKLFSRRREFADIFSSGLNLYNVELLKPYYIDFNLLSSAADIFFESKAYNEAIEYYNLLFENCCNIPQINLQKLGFAYQSIGKYDLALKYYLNYSLANEDDIWNLKHIASCYRAIGDYEKASIYLNKAIKLTPNNIALNLMLGHCYLENSKLTEAIKVYYKVEYLDDKNHSAWRPLAWSLFLNHEFDASRQYYNKIFSEDKPEMSDYLNYGHLCLACGKFEEALSYYYNVYATLNNNKVAFIEKWNKDINALMTAGVSKDDINLYLDAILMRIYD